MVRRGVMPLCAIVLSPSFLYAVIVLCRRIISPPTNREDSELLSACKDHIWRRGHQFQPRRTISRFLGELLFSRSIIIPDSDHGLLHSADSLQSATSVNRSLMWRSWRTCPAAPPSAESVTYSESRCEIDKVLRGEIFPSTCIRTSQRSF